MLESISNTEASRFDATYYAVGCGATYERNTGWLAFFDGIAARIIEDIHPGTVLDAGCALGFLVENLRRRDVQAWGIDISDYAISHIHESVKPYCSVGSIAAPFSRHYDLIVCIEVLEHMPKEDGRRAIANFCAHSSDVLFSSSPDDFAEMTHVNVQPAEYWAEEFARHGFYHDLSFDASFITPWAARFRKTGEPAHRVVREYEREISRLTRENAQLRRAANEQRNNAPVEEIIRERDALRALVAEYEQGRFMRFMKWMRGAGK